MKDAAGAVSSPDFICINQLKVKVNHPKKIIALIKKEISQLSLFHGKDYPTGFFSKLIKELNSLFTYWRITKGDGF